MSAAGKVLEVQFLKAGAAKSKGDVAEARRLYEAILRQSPRNLRAAKALAALPAARTSYRDPVPQAERDALIALSSQGRYEALLARCEALAARFPGSLMLCNSEGAAWMGLRRFERAREAFGRAIAIRDDHAESHSNLGNALKELGKPGEAIAAFRRAIALRPDFPQAHYNLANVLSATGNDEGAVAAYGRAAALKPDYGIAITGELRGMAQIGDWRAYDRFAEVAGWLGINGNPVSCFGLLPFDDDPARCLARARNAATIPLQHARPRRFDPPAAMPRRLRLGYFSSDFHDHPTMHLTARLFPAHDRDRFEVHAFSYSPVNRGEMAETARQGFDHFHEIRSMSGAAVRELAREAGLDIAIDLNGYTRHNRLELFADRLAPVQVGFLGYPGTTGGDFLDYIVADCTVIPPADTPHFTEKAIWLPHTYQPNDDSRTISDRPMTRAGLGLPETGFVFCCFNNSYKIGPAEFDVWMRLLRQIDGSVFWLLGTGEAAAANLRAQAQARGVDPERLVFAERMSPAEHIARHRFADLFLDTFLYNAHTTASDALWGSLPLVTRQGRSFHSRVAASLLRAVGLPELVTCSTDEYEALSLALAQEPERLAGVKTKLAANRLTAPLFDTELYTRHLEAGLEAAYRRFFAGLAPDHIDVATA